MGYKIFLFLKVVCGNLVSEYIGLIWYPILQIYCVNPISLIRYLELCVVYHLKIKVLNDFSSFSLLSMLSGGANHYNFCGILPIFKVNFPITISNVKITANNHFKMVPDKITGVTPTSTCVIPDHRLQNKIQTGLCLVYWKDVT